MALAPASSVVVPPTTSAAVWPIVPLAMIAALLSTVVAPRLSAPVWAFKLPKCPARLAGPVVSRVSVPVKWLALPAALTAPPPVLRSVALAPRSVPR